MTRTHLDLDRIEGLAGRLREKHFLDDESKARLPEPAADLIYLLRLERSEAAADLTALIVYVRELERALDAVVAIAEKAGPKMMPTHLSSNEYAPYEAGMEAKKDAILSALRALPRETP